MVRSRLLILLIAGCAALIAGCSKAYNPATPDVNNPKVTDVSSSQSGSQTHLWGYYDVNIDIPTQTATAVPVRGAMYTANVVTFMNQNPTNLGFHVNKTPVGSDYIDVDIDVTIKHPFPGLPGYNGYDVRGIFMGDGIETLQYNPELMIASIESDQTMLPDPADGFGGPDGYTRWFNKTEFSGAASPLFQYTQGKVASPGFNGTATLCPYKYFTDGLQKNQDVWSWLKDNSLVHGIFSSGNSITRNYYIRFPNSKGIRFGYAVIANWEGTEPEFHPSNAPEAVTCSVTNNSDLYYVDPTHNGGNLKLDISLWDWDSTISAGVMDDYKVIIESTVLSAPHQFTPSEMTPIGGGDHYSTYHVEIPANNVNSLTGNKFWVIAECADEDYTNPFDVPNLANTDKLASFFRYDLTVANTFDISGWTRNWGGSAYNQSEEAAGVAVDPSGNVYVTGAYWGTVDFDPGPGVDEHTTNDSSVNQHKDAFLSKFDASGKFLWARTWGGGGRSDTHDRGQAVACDSMGNVYVSGYFYGATASGPPVCTPVDFDPGPGVDNHTSNGYYDCFVTSFDSGGNYRWARTWGGADWGTWPGSYNLGQDEAWGVGCDSSGNVYVAGHWFSVMCDFDPGPGVDNVINASPGNPDSFVSKFQSDGTWLWTKNWGGPGVDRLEGFYVDPSGNLYSSGSFSYMVDFDPGPGVDNHTAPSFYENIYLSKLNSSGIFQWARTFMGFGHSKGTAVGSDNNGNVWCAGYFRNTVDFDPGPSTDNRTATNEDCFLAMFYQDGSWQWARNWGGSQGDMVWGGTSDTSGNIYLTGFFFSPDADFDPGIGTDTRATTGQADIWLSKFDLAGQYQWARTFGSTGGDGSRAAAAAGTQNVYFTGTFSNTVDFDPGVGVDNHTAPGTNLADAFLMKYTSEGTY
jgi:hypothetical protein